MWTTKLRTLPLAACILLLPVVSGLCGGQPEAGLSDVQQLIAQRDYPNALKLLARIQRNHPEERDETQRLIMEIISSQGREYNEVLAQLVHALYEEQDSDKALPLVGVLQKLDPKRSAAETHRWLTYVKFLKLMDSATLLLKQGKVPEAIDLYLQPITEPGKAQFDMEKPAFDSAGYGDMVTASVRDNVKRIVDAGGRARREALSLGEGSSGLGGLVSSPANAQSLNEFDAAFSPLATARTQQKSVLAATAALEATDASIRQSSQGAQGAAYLRYLISLCRGRKNKPPEGLAESIKILWEPEAEATGLAAAGEAVSALTSAKASIDDGDLAAADPKLHDAYYRSILAVKAISFTGGALDPTPSWGFSGSDSGSLRRMLEAATQSQEVATEAASLQQLVSFQRDAQTLPSGKDADSSALQSARTRAQAIESGAAKERDVWQRRVTVLRGQEETGLELAPQVEASRAMAARLDSLVAQLSQKDLEYAIALARLEEARFQSRLSEALEMRREGQDRLNGTSDGKPPPQDVFVQRKPREALHLFDTASSSLDQISADVASSKARWLSDTSHVTGSSALAAVLASFDSTDAQTRTEASVLSRLTQLAQEQHEQALAKRKEADLAFVDAGREFGAKQYDSAKLQLGDARDLYLDSLLLEEDPGVRTRYTVDIPALIQRINNAIVEQYIAEVDVQVSAGRRLFAAGEFLKSFLILETAQARWKATLGDRPNSDLDDLVGKVRNALRLSGGRDLAPDDSRAPAVNGFLNLANGKIGRAEQMPNDSSERKQLLEDAYSNVMSALDVDPVYRKAKALQLRIRKLQAKDDAAFRREARGEIDEIIAEYHGRKAQPERLYFALKDYQDIMPEYQPLKDSIQKLETSLGFRIRQPSPAEISRSNDLLAQAQSLYDPGNSLTFDPALGDIDTAIKLNPSNSTAIALRRTILLKQGSPEASNISLSGLARFAESKRLYNTEDYAGAYRILQGLMSADKRNASYPPLAQLYLLTQQKLGLR